MPDDVTQRADGRPLPGQDISYNCRVSKRDVNKIPNVKTPGHVVYPQEKSVLHGVVVDERRQLRTPLGSNSTPMESDRRRHIDRSPSHQATTPRKIRILTVSEEVFIEELAVDRDVL